MWKKILGYDVYVENNIIIRALKNNGSLPAYIYKKSKYGGWDIVNGCTVSAFRSGVYSGTYSIF